LLAPAAVAGEVALSRATGLIVTLIAILTADAAGQGLVTGADLRGTVRDASGVALPEATVVATSPETGITRVARTDREGRYAIMALPPGSYRVSAAFPAFATQMRSDVPVLLGQVVLVDFDLPPTARESIVVMPTTPVAEVDRTGVSTVIEQHQIDALPIIGRNFISFAALTPGVTPTEPAIPGAETSGLSFTGQRSRDNNIMVDGLDNNDRNLGSAQASLGQEAVREFQVLTTAYSAEFGNAAGGVVNIVTKSGTNTRKGGLFFFHRNEHLNAKDHFERFDPFGTRIERVKAPYRQYQWGGILGGPIRADRTFYFASLERLSIEASNFVNIDTDAAALLESTGFPVALGNVPYNVTATQVIAKMAHQWTPARSIMLSGHLSAVTNGNFRSYGGITAASHGVSQDRDDWALSATETDVWGRGWVNEARGQLARHDQQTLARDPRCGGLCSGESDGGPEIIIPGVAILGRNIYEPTARDNWRVQVSNIASRASGSHMVKAGASVNYLNQRARTPLEFGGSFTFAPLPAIPGVLPTAIRALDAFAFGLPALYVRGFGNSAGPFSYQDLSAFGQDDWRLGSRLTVKAGLRYQVQIWPAVDTTVAAPAGSSLHYEFPQDRNNLAPRLGVSFDLDGTGRTSLDGAYGVFYGSQLAAILGSQIVFDGSPDGVRLLVLPFPASVAAWQAPAHRIAEPSFPFPSSVVTVAPGMKSPYAHQASIGVNHAFGSHLRLSASLVQVRSEHQIGSLNYNPLVPALGPGRRPNDIAGIAGSSAEVFQFTDFGRARYRGLLVSLRHRLNRGSDFMASYTLSEAEDNSSVYLGHVESTGAGRNPDDLLGLPLGFDPDLERGPADTDQRHRLVLSGSHLAPAGIQIAAVVTAGSGRPYTPLAGADLNGDGLLFADRARTDVSDPATSVMRNSERLGNEFRADLRLLKRIGVSTSAALDVMVDIFNLFNRTNFTEVNNVFGPGSFPRDPVRDTVGRVTYGRYEKAAPPRQIQLAARLNF
jgi:hypothetical protein